MRRLAIYFAVAMLLVPSSARTDDKGPAVAANDQEIPFELSHGFLIAVRGRLGPLAGTSRSVVDRKIAEKLDLQRHPSRLANFGHEASVEAGTFPEVQFVIGMDLFRAASFLIGYETRPLPLRQHGSKYLKRRIP